MTDTIHAAVLANLCAKTEMIFLMLIADRSKRENIDFNVMLKEYNEKVSESSMNYLKTILEYADGPDISDQTVDDLLK